MDTIVPSSTAGTPRNSLEHIRPEMAAVDLKDLEQAQRAAYGEVLRHAVKLAGFSDKQAASRLDVDPARLSRWYAGTENPQMWRWHGDARLRDALRLAEASDAERAGCDVVVETVIKVVRRHVQWRPRGGERDGANAGDVRVVEERRMGERRA